MNKRALLLAPNFYGYENSIINELRKINYDVEFVNSEPGAMEVSLIHCANKIGVSMDFLCKKFCRGIKKKIETKKFDVVLVICGKYLTTTFLDELRKRHISSKGKMVLYYWDSRSNVADADEKLDLFDKVFSFDKKDCQRNCTIEFLPLFYRDEYDIELNSTDNRRKKYDLAIVASYNLFRYELVEAIIRNNEHVSIFSWIFADKKMVLLHKIFRKKCRNVDLQRLKKQKLNAAEIAGIYENTVAILDFPHPAQSGLAIRVFEGLAMQKKIVTTNEDIKTYDFYNSKNIFVLDESRKLPSKSWFLSDYVPIDECIVKKYSISNWITKVVEQ